MLGVKAEDSEQARPPFLTKPDPEQVRLAFLAKHLPAKLYLYSADGRQKLQSNCSSDEEEQIASSSGSAISTSTSSPAVPTRLLLLKGSATPERRRSQFSRERLKSSGNLGPLLVDGVDTKELEIRDELERSFQRAKQREGYEKLGLEMETPILKHVVTLDDARKFQRTITRILEQETKMQASDANEEPGHIVEIGDTLYERDYSPEPFTCPSPSSSSAATSPVTPPSRTYRSLSQPDGGPPTLASPLLPKYRRTSVSSLDSAFSISRATPSFKKKWTRVKIIFLQDPATNQPAFLVSEEDISESKNLHTELASQKQMHSRFLADLSHELRTPLNGVVGMLQHLLLEGNLSAKQQSDICHALTSANAVTDLFASSLDPQAQELELHSRETGPRVISLMDCIQMVQSVIKEKFKDQDDSNKVELLMEYPMYLIGFIDARTDLSRIRNVLAHLLSSSIRRAKQLPDTSPRRRNIVRVSLKIRDPSPFQQSYRFLFKIRSPGTPPPSLLLPLPLQREIYDIPQSDVSIQQSCDGGTQILFSLSAEKVNAGMAGGRRMQTLPWPKGEIRVWIVSPRAKEIERSLSRCYLRKKIEFRNCYSVNSAKMSDEDVQTPKQQLVLVDEAIGGIKEEVMKKVEENIGAQCYVYLRDEKVSKSDAWEEMEKPLEPLGLYRLLIKFCLPMTPGTQRMIQNIPDEKMKTIVLLVEDNPTNIKVMTKLLARLKVEVEVVENGEAAVARMRRQMQEIKENRTKARPRNRRKGKQKKKGKKKNGINKEKEDEEKKNVRIGLILMDVRMSGMNGLTASKTIREMEKQAEVDEEGDDYMRVPIVAVSAGATDVERQECQEAGMDYFLAKPVQLGELSDVLQRFLGVVCAAPLRSPDSSTPNRK